MIIKNKELEVRKGFTLIELIVSVAIFIILITAVSVTFIRILRTQRALASLFETNNNISIILEQMAREMRTGVNFTKISDTEIRFVNTQSETVRYRLNLAAVERGIESGVSVNFEKITSDNVRVLRFNPLLLGQSPGDGFPPRITIVLSVEPVNPHLKDVIIDMQTTVSARNIDT